MALYDIAVSILMRAILCVWMLCCAFGMLYVGSLYALAELSVFITLLKQVTSEQNLKNR